MLAAKGNDKDDIFDRDNKPFALSRLYNAPDAEFTDPRINNMLKMYWFAHRRNTKKDDTESKEMVVDPIVPKT